MLLLGYWAFELKFSGSIYSDCKESARKLVWLNKSQVFYKIGRILAKKTESFQVKTYNSNILKSFTQH